MQTKSETENTNSMAKMESVRNANGDYGVDNVCMVGKVGMSSIIRMRKVPLCSDFDFCYYVAIVVCCIVGLIV